MKKLLILLAIAGMISFGCASTKTVFYEVQMPRLIHSYSSSGEDAPLTYEEWMEIIGFGDTEETPSKVEEKEL